MISQNAKVRYAFVLTIEKKFSMFSSYFRKQSGNNWRQFDCLHQIVELANPTIAEQSSFRSATQSQKLHYFTQNNCDKNPFQNVRHPYCSMCAHGTANWNIKVLKFKMNNSYLSGRYLYNFLNNRYKLNRSP